MYKKVMRVLIKSTLWLLDSDYRKSEVILNDNTKKFTHTQDGLFRSDFGNVSKVFRTVPYSVWQLTTDTHELLAADKHLIIKEEGVLCWLCDLKVGDKIKTDTGIETVLLLEDLNIRTHMYDLQVETDDHLYYSNGILSHNTTCAVSYLLWKAMFTDDMTILIVANNQQMALEIMSRVRYAYEGMENCNWLRAGIVKYNEGTIEFDNKSKIVSRATSPYSTRGLSVSLVYCDEFSFLQPHIAAEFWSSILPTLATGGSCIITSTPNNDEDQFAQLWFGANNYVDDNGNELDRTGPGKNGFFPFKSTWRDHPDRNEAWADEFRNSLGEEKFKREFEGEFISRDETLVSSMTLRNLVSYKPIKKDINGVRWYTPLRANRTYFVGLDPSMGHAGDSEDTDGGDNSSIVVYELPSMDQVAEWRSRNTLARDQVKILIKILISIFRGLAEEDAQESEPEIYWSFENNSMGHTIEEIIHSTGEDSFPGVLVNEPHKSGGVKKRRGLNTNQKTKLQACSSLKTYLESNRLTVKSAAIISELKNYVVSAGSYRARWGSGDDLIAATLVCLRMMLIVSKWDSTVLESVSSAIDLSEVGLRDDVEPLPVFIL